MSKRMGRVAAAAAALALAGGVVAGCGDSSDSDSTAAADTSAGAPYDITIGEWVVDLEDEKTKILEAYVADTPSCNAEVDDGFVLEIAGASSNFDQSTPLPDVVKKYC